MGADGFGRGWGGGGINPISQPIFGLNPSPTESSNEEKGVKYAIFGGGTASKRAMRGDAWPQNNMS